MFCQMKRDTYCLRYVFTNHQSPSFSILPSIISVNDTENLHLSMKLLQKTLDIFSPYHNNRSICLYDANIKYISQYTTIKLHYLQFCNFKTS